MSTKHHSSHPNRGRSNYPRRPGMYSHGPMAEIEGSTGLRSRQERRIRETCSVDHVHDAHGYDCNGQPFPRASEFSSLTDD